MFASYVSKTYAGLHTQAVWSATASDSWAFCLIGDLLLPPMTAELMCCNLSLCVLALAALCYGGPSTSQLRTAAPSD